MTLEQIIEEAQPEPTSPGAIAMHTDESACRHLRMPVRDVREALAESSVQVGDCREWTKDRDGRGYGQLVTREGGVRRRFAVHRLAYLMINGPIPAGLCVLHICDNRACINPNHLVVGSHTANMQDMKRKGRSMNGAASPRAKLTEEEAERIRTLGRMGAYHHDIAAQFRVSRSTVTKIINGTAYRDDTHAD